MEAAASAGNLGEVTGMLSGVEAALDKACSDLRNTHAHT
jgi:hypothetical protein